MLRVFTTLYNAEDYINHCIFTIKYQSYKKFECYIFNDLSTDNSKNIALDAIDGDKRFHLIDNTEKRYQSGNYYHTIHSPEFDIQKNDPIFLVDGDDWLPDMKTFERIIQEYEDENIWMTFGNFKTFCEDGTMRENFPYKSEYPDDFNSIRDKIPGFWRYGHLRTFRAGLFMKIKKCDLKLNGQFFSKSGDMATLIPMFEMAGKEHVKMLKDVNYVYNISNPINDHKGDGGREQFSIANIIKHKQKYQKIERY